ncbi:hypothetical protein JTE90_016521, partial [Oedothorax gibbosus]
SDEITAEFKHINKRFPKPTGIHLVTARTPGEAQREAQLARAWGEMWRLGVERAETDSAASPLDGAVCQVVCEAHSC